MLVAVHARGDAPWLNIDDADGESGRSKPSCHGRRESRARRIARRRLRLERACSCANRDPRDRQPRDAVAALDAANRRRRERDLRRGATRQRGRRRATQRPSAVFGRLADPSEAAARLTGDTPLLLLPVRHGDAVHRRASCGCASIPDQWAWTRSSAARRRRSGERAPVLGRVVARRRRRGPPARGLARPGRQSRQRPREAGSRGSTVRRIRRTNRCARSGRRNDPRRRRRRTAAAAERTAAAATSGRRVGARAATRPRWTRRAPRWSPRSASARAAVDRRATRRRTSTKRPAAAIRAAARVTVAFCDVPASVRHGDTKLTSWTQARARPRAAGSVRAARVPRHARGAARRSASRFRRTLVVGPDPSRRGRQISCAWRTAS